MILRFEELCIILSFLQLAKPVRHAWRGRVVGCSKLSGFISPEFRWC